MKEEKFPVDLCLKCSTCNTVCPIYGVYDKFPGPKYLGPELARFKKQGNAPLAEVEFCTGCRRCELACPAGVPITDFTHELKAEIARKEGISLRNRILGNNQAVSALASRMAPLSNFFLEMNLVRALMENLFGIKNRPFPKYAFPVSLPRTGKIKDSKHKVVYFMGCYSRYFGTKIPGAVLDIMNKAWVELIIPEQKCCGIPMISNGLLEQARDNAAYNLEILSGYVKQGYDIITTCPSCALNLKMDYVKLWDLPEAGRVAAHIYDAAEYLLDRGLISPKMFSPAGKRVFYHLPCHAKALGVGAPNKDILGLIPELELVVREQKCCGQAGTFGFKKEKFDLSWEIGNRLFLDAAEARPDLLATECGMCAMQLAQGTHLPTLHPMEILQEALAEQVEIL